ncbi:MAG: type II secretion system protein [Candidatus Kerfeldbacteria bacterium]|nr:type II secretion system protein [Candidatus Kerfeldbacteria bacterium]
MSNNRGFTLIELLVVIAVIGILSAIGFTSLSGAREKANDTKRKTDVSSIRTALLLYFDDHTNHYPTVATSGTIEAASGNLATALVTEYMPNMPAATGVIAPCTNANMYWYVADGSSGTANDATSYAVAAQLEIGGCQRAWVVNEFYAREIDEVAINGIEAARCGSVPDICAAIAPASI